MEEILSNLDANHNCMMDFISTYIFDSRRSLHIPFDHQITYKYELNQHEIKSNIAA